MMLDTLLTLYSKLLGCSYCRDANKLFLDCIDANFADAGLQAIVPDYIRCPNCRRVVNVTLQAELTLGIMDIIS